MEEGYISTGVHASVETREVLRRFCSPVCETSFLFDLELPNRDKGGWPASPRDPSESAS